MKRLDQIYSGRYRALSTVSKKEARTLMVPAWLDRRIKETSINTVIRPEKIKQVKVKIVNRDKRVQQKWNTTKYSERSRH